MAKPGLYQRMRKAPQVRLALFILGCLLMVLAPLLGPLPGPGFVLLFPAGMALTLQNSPWAKRIYARFKRRHPRYAGWTDRIMRRASAARHRERQAQKELALATTPDTPLNAVHESANARPDGN